MSQSTKAILFQVPDVTLFEDSPGGKVSLTSLCAGKKVVRLHGSHPILRLDIPKVVVFGVPGAFTPGCSKTHLPGYVAKAEEMKAKGVEEIVCVSVNDPFVMEAWGKDQGAAGKVSLIRSIITKPEHLSNTYHFR